MQRAGSAVDLKNLKTFLYAAELSSFTRAAERLGFSQPTVTFQIKQLERELDTHLFERVRHTVKLTEEGRAVLRYAYQIDKLTTELDTELRSEQGVPTGHVRLAMADSLCDRMDGAFRDFWSRYPGIRLKITAAGTGEMFRLLNHNDVDLVLTLDGRIYDAEYTLIHEERAGTHFVAAADHPLAGRRIGVRELMACPFLLTEKGMSYRRLLDEGLAARSLEIIPALETGNVGLICRLAEQGAGCSFLPDYATEEAVAAGRLARLAVEDFEIDIWKQLFCHRDKWISRPIRAVMDY